MQKYSFLVLFLQLLGVDGVLKNTGTTVSLNGINYFINPDSVGFVSVPRSINASSQFVPMTVFNTDAKDLSISSAAQHFAAIDDVFQSGFLDIALVQSNGSGSLNVTVTNAPGGTIVIQSSVKSSAKTIPEGPYFLSASSGGIHRAYRLYPDFAGAFTETCITDKNGGFHVLPANVPGQSLAVAVPSRLYFIKTAEKPLDGVRIGVKDIFDIKGLKTSNGNRAWYNFYPPVNATGTAVQRLIDAGAVVVGKMKTGQFADSADWIDYHSPFNPRGDGYQDPSGSSSGPGAGQATYPWLDLSLGSDTGGSIQGPAESNGIYGNRPSHGLVPLDHVMPLAPSMDTAGFLARDPDLWATAADVLYGGLKRYPEFPSEILTQNNYPTNETDVASTLAIDFVNKLSKFLGGASIKPYNVDAAFTANPPAAANTKNINKLGSLIYPILTTKEQVRLVRNHWFDEYASKYDGRTPHIDPGTEVSWNYGISQPESLVAEALRNQSIFADWVAKEVLPYSNKSCSSRIIIDVGSTGLPDVRDGSCSDPAPPSGWYFGRLPGYSGSPGFTVPIGEVARRSPVTHHQEVLPVGIDITVAKGCDGMLFDMIRGLIKEGILKPAQPGRSVVDGGAILY